MKKPIEFFKDKKSWSVMKDKILKNYLIVYINKVKQFKKTVVIVDGFAGAGIYKDGTHGSPIIICKILESYKKKGVEALGIFIEENPDCFRELEKNLEYFKRIGIAFTEFADFRKILPEIIKAVKQVPAFFYLDPFGIIGLEFGHLEKIFEKVKISSTELLINFNYKTFCRQAEAYPKLVKNVMNGDYYKEILEDKKFSKIKKEEMILEKYKDLYRKYFDFVASCPVMYKDEQGAKYHLIFATSHFDGLRLMNNIMGNVYRGFYAEGRLFNAMPLEKARDLKLLEKNIMELMAKNRITDRKSIERALMPRFFMRYNEGDYKSIISESIKKGKIYSETKRSRINDFTKLSLVEFSKNFKK